MSLIGDVSKDVSKVLAHLERYEKMRDEAEPLFKLDGMRIAEIARTLPNNLARYDQAAGQLKNLEEFLNVKLEETESKLWKKFNEKYPRALTTKDIQAYIAGEPDFIAAKELVLEVKFLKNEMDSIVKGFEQMGWMLKYTTDLVINDLRDAII